MPLRQLENSLTRVNRLLADIDIKISSERDLLKKLDQENDGNDLNEALRRLPALRSSDRNEPRRYSFQNPSNKKPSKRKHNTETRTKMKNSKINRNGTLTKVLRSTEAKVNNKSNETAAFANLSQILEAVFPDNASIPFKEDFTRLQRRMGINTRHIIKYNKLIRHFILKHTTLFHTFAKHYKRKHRHSRHHKIHHKHRHGMKIKKRNKFENEDNKNTQEEQMEEENKEEIAEEVVENHEKPPPPPQSREGVFEQDPVANEGTEANVNRAKYLDLDIQSTLSFNPNMITGQYGRKLSGPTTIERNGRKNAILQTILKDASYSYEEVYVKTMLLDALFHGNDTLDKKSKTGVKNN